MGWETMNKTQADALRIRYKSLGDEIEACAKVVEAAEKVHADSRELFNLREQVKELTEQRNAALRNNANIEALRRYYHDIYYLPGEGIWTPGVDQGHGDGSPSDYLGIIAEQQQADGSYLVVVKSAAGKHFSSIGHQGSHRGGMELFHLNPREQVERWVNTLPAEPGSRDQHPYRKVWKCDASKIMEWPLRALTPLQQRKKDAKEAAGKTEDKFSKYDGEGLVL